MQPTSSAFWPPNICANTPVNSTGRVDVREKRDDYAALGIPEYWRFDETGCSHGARLAGARLVDGVYRPIDIEELEDDVLQGCSAVLHLDLRWEHGQLKWHDPEMGRHIATYDDQVARAETAETRAERERAGRVAAEVRVEQAEALWQARERRAAPEAELRTERAARAALEAQVRELKAQLQRPHS